METNRKELFNNEVSDLKRNKQCKHNYELYKNDYGEVVAVCSKCMDAYF